MKNILLHQPESDHEVPVNRALTNQSERGQILILTALSMVVLLGMAALSIDASFMYDKRNQLYAAADAAAKLGAAEVFRDATICGNAAALQNFGNDQVTRHGFNPSGATSVVMHCPPSSGPYATNSKFVEAIVSEPTNTFFGRILGVFTMTPGARAVAGTASGPNCLIILGPGTLSIGNGTTLNMPNCGIADGGDLNTQPTTNVNASSVSVTVGSCPGNVANCTSGAPTPTDPFITLPPLSPVPPHSCTSPLLVTSNILIDVSNADDYYCGMTIDNAVVTFNAGEYFIAGPITARNGGSSPTLNGSGVMFFLAGPNGAIDLGASNFVTMNLSAPTSGTYNAILFYQERGNTNAANLSKNGNAGTLTLSGAMYFPNADLTMKNNNGVSNDCALIVAQSATLNNNSSLSNTCSGFGGSPILTVAMAE